MTSRSLLWWAAARRSGLCLLGGLGLFAGVLRPVGAQEAPSAAPPSGEPSQPAREAPPPAPSGPQLGGPATAPVGSTPAGPAPGAGAVDSDELDATLIAEEPDAEVVVLAERVRRAPGSAHLLARETLERYEYDDPHATLQLVPGVYVRQEDGFGLRPNIGIRGAVSDRSAKVALMEDGVLFGPAPYSAPAAYFFPVISRMDQLQVLKGPAAIQYGPQTVGGALDLMTRPIPGRSAGALDLAAGEYGYGKLHAHAGSSDGTNSFLIEGIHLRSSGFKELPSGDETGFYRNEWMFKASRTFAPGSDLRHQLSLKLTYSDEQSDETYLGLTDADFRRDPLQRYAPSDPDRMRWHRTSVVVSHVIEPSYGLTITTDAYRHDLARIWSKANHFGGASLFQVLTNPDAAASAPFLAILRGEADTASDAELLYVGPNERNYVSQGVQTRAELSSELGPFQQRAELGLRFHYDRIERRHSEDAFRVVGGRLERAELPTVFTAINQAETYALAAYVTDELGYGPVTFTPGLRFEALWSRFEDILDGGEDESTLQMILPGIGVRYALGDSLALIGGVHRGMSPPPPGSGPGVEPESSINYEVGARYADGPRRAELIGYYNDYRNITDICTLSSGCDEANLDRQFDAGRARIYGLEALVEDEIALGALRFPVGASYTLTRTQFLETFQSQDPIFGEVEAGDELPYVPRHQGRASVGVEAGPGGGYVSGTYVSRMREQSGSGPLDLALATDAQFTIDVGAHYDVMPKVRVYAQVRNLLDEAYIASRRPYGARPNPPRWIQVGVKLDFE